MGKYNNSNLILDPMRWTIHWVGEPREVNPQTLAKTISDLYPNAVDHFTLDK